MEFLVLLLLLLPICCSFSFRVSSGAVEYGSYCLIILGFLLSGFEAYIVTFCYLLAITVFSSLLLLCVYHFHDTSSFFVCQVAGRMG